MHGRLNAPPVDQVPVQADELVMGVDGPELGQRRSMSRPRRSCETQKLRRASSQFAEVATRDSVSLRIHRNQTDRCRV